MKNKISLSTYIVISFLMVFMFSCQKENYDVSDTTQGEFDPEVNYTGDDNTFSFALSKFDGSSNNIQGGSSNLNNITKEVLSNGEIKWKLFSTVTDGFTVINEITFITSNTDAGDYPIEEFHYTKIDDTGTTLEEHLWTSAEISPGALITVSALTDTPGIVSGSLGDGFDVIITPDLLEYHYGANFSEVPID